MKTYLLFLVPLLFFALGLAPQAQPGSGGNLAEQLLRRVNALRAAYEVRSAVKTTKPVRVRPQGPRFFTRGDAVVLSAVVNNNTTQALPVEVTLDLTGLRLGTFAAGEIRGASKPGAPKPGAPKPEEPSSEPVPSNEPKIRIMVPAQGQRRVDWRAHAETPGKATIRTTARSTLDSDAVQKTFPVYEYGIEKCIASGAVLKGLHENAEQTLTLELPEARRPGSETLTLWLEPTLARSMINALDYLADYPYGCTEQTLSRFVPAVVCSRVLRQLGIRKPELEAKLPDMINAGLGRLADFQHADGGWGWWKEDQSDLYMTAYVLQGLSQAMRSEAQIDPEMIMRGERFLTGGLVNLKDQPDLTAYALYTLALVRNPGSPMEPVKEAFDRLWEEREKLNPCSRALYALACWYSGQSEHAVTLGHNLRTGVIQDKANGTAHWGRSGVFDRWSDGAIEATAFALRALLLVEPESELVEQSMNWLVLSRKGAHWENTRDTAVVIRALSDYIRFLNEDRPDWRAEVEVNGQRVATMCVTPEKAFDFEGKVEVPAAALHSGRNSVVIRRIGSGPLYASARLTYFTREEEIKPAGNEVFAERHYYRTRQDPTLAGSTKTTREELRPGTALAPGDRVEVELTLEAKNDYEYMMVEDPKAAGMAPAEIKNGIASGGGLSVHRELRDEKTVFFITSLPQGKHTLKYELRAEIPGVFAALPTQVHAMYVPEIRANSAGARVEIK